MTRLLLRTTVIAVIAVATAGLVPMQRASASTITIDSCSGTGFDGLLLYERILEANDEETHPGPDTIVTSCDYFFGAPYPGTSYVLPPITGPLTIVGGSYHVLSDDLNDRFGFLQVPEGGSVQLQGVTLVTDVSQSGTGSFVYNAGGDLGVTDSFVLGVGRPIPGPALVTVFGATTHITRTTFRGIDDETPSGTIVNGGYTYIVDSTLEDNQRETVARLNEPPTILNSGYLSLDGTVLRQSEPASGEVLYMRGVSNSGDLVVSNSAFSGFTGVRGAAIQSIGGTLDIDRSSFVSNAARFVTGIGGGTGGAIFAESTTDISNSLFWKNSSTLDGGAIENLFYTAIHYSTFAGNTGRNGDDVDNLNTLSVATSIIGSCNGSVIDGGGNLVTVAGSACPGTLGNPKLLFRTFPGVRGFVGALQAGSDAIDFEDASAHCPSVDQRNLTRPAGGLCDVGAFENEVPTAPGSIALRNGTNPTNTGLVTLDWTASTDAESEPVAYTVYGKDADDPTETLLATVAADAPIAAPITLSEGTYDLRVEASDGIHQASGTLTGLVVDKTAPPVPTTSADRAPDYTADDGTGWYKDSVTVTYHAADPTLADGSPGSGLAYLTPPETVTTTGAHSATGHAEDNALNVGGPATDTYWVDATAPTVGFTACPATVLLGSARTLSWTASDAGSGLSTPGSGSVPVDTSTVGERTLSAAATDHVGHSTTAECVVHVVYDFGGFFSPIANPPTVNKASAGGLVNVSFSLQGNQGLNVFAPGYPVSAPITCGTNPASTTGLATTAVKPGLTYAASPRGRYVYPWKTVASWVGTCRQLVVKLADGTYHRANFSFK